MQMEEFHWALDLLQNLDVGIIIIDRHYRIQAWNNFVENHSKLTLQGSHNQSIFEIFHEIPEEWFRNKVDTVFLLENAAFTIWEQRPYVFRFKNYQPITGTADYMYQNLSLIPLRALDNQINYVGIIIYNVTEVVVAKEALRATNHRLERLNRTDNLTRLFNRRYWEECLTVEYHRFQRTQQPLSLVIFDIDQLKKINDLYDYQSGDQVLRITADLLRQVMRRTDIGGRYGGEEFAVLLIDSDSNAAMIFAERLRATIEAYTIEGEHKIRYTISAGIATLSSQIKDPPSLIKHAQNALFWAKRNGRNRVEAAE